MLCYVKFATIKNKTIPNLYPWNFSPDFLASSKNFPLEQISMQSIPFIKASESPQWPKTLRIQKTLPEAMIMEKNQLWGYLHHTAKCDYQALGLVFKTPIPSIFFQLFDHF